IGNDSIAYTFVVDKYGNLYRVRDRDRISWHTGNGWGNTKHSECCSHSGQPRNRQSIKLLECIGCLII
ncbi:N-acetylmuramoyl-L-alanine amidase, partial [bacterium]|nr:N-acetylmuramoyl-L-alanine amidase [bacterium]